MSPKYSTQSMIDMDEIAAYIQQSSPRSALRFLEAVEKSVDHLAVFPEFGARYESDIPELSDLRICLVSGFAKYVLIYRLVSSQVYVERVVLGSRDLTNLLREDS